MILKSIKLKNYKCFESFEVNFEKINLISGVIGVGKSSIIDALIFALYGYSTALLLSDLPTKGKATSCKIEAVIEDLKGSLTIIREFPLKLTLKEGEKTLKSSTAELNQYLIDRFGSRLVFQQFRVLNDDKDSNFLEQGNTVLKKILFANTDSLFNEIRNNLNVMKLEREKLNRDTFVVCKHYPSEKRLKILKDNYTIFSNKLSDVENEIGSLEREINDNSSQYTRKESRHSQIQENVGIINQQINDLQKETTLVIDSKKCFVCHQSLSENKTIDITKEQNIKIEKKLKELDNLKNEDIELCSKIPELKTNIENLTDIKRQYVDDRRILQEDKTNLQDFIFRLESRLKQKEYIYTTKDCLVIKQAIEELDKLSSYYLVETIRSLEPIINEVLTKIGFECTFDTNDKGKFDIILTKENVKYKYNDFSRGQRLLLHTALKLALLMQQGASGLISSDEGLGSLDNETLDYVLNLFKALPFQLIFTRHGYTTEDSDINIIKLGAVNEKI